MSKIHKNLNINCGEEHEELRADIFCFPPAAPLTTRPCPPCPSWPPGVPVTLLRLARLGGARRSWPWSTSTTSPRSEIWGEAEAQITRHILVPLLLLLLSSLLLHIIIITIISGGGKILSEANYAVFKTPPKNSKSFTEILMSLPPYDSETYTVIDIISSHLVYSSESRLVSWVSLATAVWRDCCPPTLHTPGLPTTTGISKGSV